MDHVSLRHRMHFSFLTHIKQLLLVTFCDLIGTGSDGQMLPTPKGRIDVKVEAVICRLEVSEK